MSKWINNKLPIWANIIKPCRELGYCPYGQLVEEYPFSEDDKYRSCLIFGHDCPVYYQAEVLCEDEEPSEEEIKNCVDEIKERINIMLKNMEDEV